MWAMIATWAFGFTAKFTVPAEVISGSLMDSISGCIVPLLILGVMEIVSAVRGRSSGMADRQ